MNWIKEFLKRAGLEDRGDAATIILRSLIVIVPLLLLFVGGLIGYSLAQPEEPSSPQPAPVEVTVRESADQDLLIAPEGPPTEIPGLSALNLMASLDGVPSGRSYECPGASASRGSLVWRCTSGPAGSKGAAYEVNATGGNPRTVSSVAATANGATNEEAAEFLAHVAREALRGTGASDPTAWIEENLSSGGRLGAGGAELSLYGTDEARTVVIVGTRVLVPEPRIEVPQPKLLPEITGETPGKADSKTDAPGKSKASPDNR